MINYDHPHRLLMTMTKKKTKAVAPIVYTDEMIDKLTAEEHIAKLTREEKEALYRWALAESARRWDTPVGFAAFYEFLYRRKLPVHARAWVEAMYRAHEEGVGLLLWAWRGSWKTTTLSVTFLAFRIGHEPHKTSLVVCANDDSANKVTAAIAEIIENNPAWKSVFGRIVPHKERGWGAEGYWVRDTALEPPAWAEKQAGVVDPTLVGGGWNSSRLIGKHPTGVLNIDDIHDERNSMSERESQSVVVKVSDTIIPMAIRDDKSGKLSTWMNVIGTPWSETDAYHYLKNTGEMEFLSAPVMVEADIDGDGVVYIDGKNRQGITFVDVTGWWKLTWPDKFNVDAIISSRALSGARGFARMYLLDLVKAKMTGLKYYLYPHENIDPRWQMAGGCDLATVMKRGWRDDPGRDLFSHAWGAKEPLGRIVVVDGVLEQCTQAQAEEHLKKAQTLFGPRWKLTVLEGDGIGEQFYVSLVRRNPGLRVIMQKTRGKGKRYRQEQEMGPWLENGTVMISDADTPYLNALRRALDDFPDGNNDVRDGLYWLCYAFPELLQVQRVEEALPSAFAVEKQPSVWAAFGRR